MVTFVMNTTERKLISAIQANPLASQQELAETLGMSRESIAGYISRLTKRGAILGKGYILPERENIVVIGGANVDLTGTATNAYRGGDSNPGKVAQSAGGVGRNIAENLARLGSHTSMITLVGYDSRGRFLVDHARDAGINTQDFIQWPDSATSTYLALNNEQGELIGAVADMSIVEQLTPSLLNEKRSRLNAASLIVVEANLPAATLAWLAEQSLTAPLVADAVSATKAVKLAPLLSKLSVLKVNVSEARALLDLPKTTQLDELSLATALLDKGVATVLLSLGARGVLFANSDTHFIQAVPACDMQSDTGAGDALMAGFLHAQQRYESPEQQVSFALACAACTLEAKDAVNTKLTESYVTHRFESFIQPSATLSASAETEI